MGQLGAMKLSVDHIELLFTMYKAMRSASKAGIAISQACMCLKIPGYQEFIGGWFRKFLG